MKGTASERIRAAREHGIGAAGDFAGCSKWLRSNSAAQFVDDAVLGCLPAYEAEDLLRDFDIEPTRVALRWLGLEVNAAITEGA